MGMLYGIESSGGLLYVWRAAVNRVRMQVKCRDEIQRNITTEEISVAILDTGIGRHPDFGDRILSFVDHCGHIQTQKPPVKSGCEEKAQNGYALIAVVRYDLLHHGPQPGQKALLWDLAAGRHRSGVGGQIAESAF